MHGTSVPTVSAGYCGVETGDFDISLVNILQRLVHGGRAFLFTVNEIGLALSAAGGAEIVEQFVVVGVAGYAAFALACVGTVVWQVSLLLAGAAWAEAQTQTELPELPGQK